jgi:hypothetical protein
MIRRKSAFAYLEQFQHEVDVKAKNSSVQVEQGHEQQCEGGQKGKRKTYVHVKYPQEVEGGLEEGD